MGALSYHWNDAKLLYHWSDAKHAVENLLRYRESHKFIEKEGQEYQ